MKVLVSLNIPEIGLEMLRNAGHDVEVWRKEKPMTPKLLIENSRKHDALLCRHGDVIDEAFLNRNRHLQVISVFSAGFDNIDLQAANRLGIPIGNAPDAMSHATADIAFGLMLSVARKFFYMHKTIAKGEWGYFKPRANLGMELMGKTLGVFGLGRIGMEFAKRCHRAYDMEIIYHNRTRNQEAEENLRAKKVSLDDLLMQSDVLSVHSILSDETKGIFNRLKFSKMKETSIFINTARGAIHNEIDLIEALEKKQIWGAGLDVTNPEPMKPDNPLLSMENVAITPHIGSATVEARDKMASYAAENIISFVLNGKIPYLVNTDYRS